MATPRSLFLPASIAALVLMTWPGCGSDAPETLAPTAAVGFCDGETLFGRPSPNTGLDASVCTDTCPDCDGGPFSAAIVDEAFLEGLRTWTLLDPPPPLAEDPYAAPPPMPGDAAQGVCAVVVVSRTDRTYRLETFPSAQEAALAGAVMTHDGPCGLCSDLGSLAVYAGVGDLTQPVRACGLEGMFQGIERNLACLQEIGFNEACASIWYWNTVHTRERCQETCLRLLNAPYHDPDGSLNPCLQCDEALSGPVFKAVAGRTRRNSGLATALCRPCHEVRPIIHEYE